MDAERTWFHVDGAADKVVAALQIVRFLLEDLVAPRGRRRLGKRRMELNLASVAQLLEEINKRDLGALWQMLGHPDTSPVPPADIFEKLDPSKYIKEIQHDQEETRSEDW